jgi:hypothetical protein
VNEKKRIPTSNEPIVWAGPFAMLKDVALSSASEGMSGIVPRHIPLIAPKKTRGRVDIIRQTPHRGGKTVTVVKGFTGIGQAEQESLVAPSLPVAPFPPVSPASLPWIDFLHYSRYRMHHYSDSASSLSIHH